MSQNFTLTIRKKINTISTGEPKWSALFVCGFLAAMIIQLINGKNPILYEYLCSENFQSFFCLEVNRNQVFVFLLYKRMLLFLTFLGVSVLTKFPIIMPLFCILLGFAIGTVITGANLLYGWNGIPLTVGLFFPQFLFYIPGTILFLDGCYEMQVEQKKGNLMKRNRQVSLLSLSLRKIMFALAVVIIGILTESYVNPITLKVILKLFIW